VILQPSYVPWRGVFDQIRRADVFVHYDDVQYDKHGWRNRNRIKGANGSFWITIPVTLPQGHGKTTLHEARISYQQKWREKHWAAIRGSYSSAPYFTDLVQWLLPHYQTQVERLVDFTIPLQEACARALGVTDTEFVRASSLSITGGRTERLVEICRAVGAERYISGPSAQDYLDRSAFDQAGIRVKFIDYNFAPYPQLHGEFDSQVSILDALAMLGTDAATTLNPVSIADCSVDLLRPQGMRDGK